MTDAKFPPPDWAIQRAIDMRASESGSSDWYGNFDVVRRSPARYPTMIAFARYISQHEQPPVDPLLIEAREIVANEWESRKLEAVSQKIRDGKMDDDPAVKCVYLVLSKGR